MYHGSLPITGGITIGAVALGQTQIAAIALGLILVGALLVRFGFRRNRAATDA